MTEHGYGSRNTTITTITLNMTFGHEVLFLLYGLARAWNMGFGIWEGGGWKEGSFLEHWLLLSLRLYKLRIVDEFFRA